MNMKQDPPRLLDPNSATDPLLRDVLQLTSASTPSAAQLQALALKVSAATAAGVAASTTLKTQPPWAQAGAKTAALKLSAVLLIAGGAAWLGLSTEPVSRAGGAHPPLPAPTPLALQPVALPSRGPTAVPPTVTGEASVGSQLNGAPVVTAQAASTEAPAQRRARAITPLRARGLKSKRAAIEPARTRSVAPAVADATAHDEQQTAVPAAVIKPAASELTLLSRAQGLLARDPEAALEAIDEHARAYPRGEFAQERDALAIDALRRLGRSDEMRARARAFLQRYPASPHRDRIAALLP